MTGNQQKTIDHDFLLKRFASGMELIRPEADSKRTSLLSPTHTVANFLKLPMNIYFYDLNNTFQLSNEDNAQACGFDSPYHVIGKNLSQTNILNDFATRLKNNNKKIIESNKMNIMDEEIRLTDGYHAKGLTIKMPLYYQQKITGIVGCTIIYNEHSLASALSLITDFGFMNNDMSHFLLNQQKINIQLTQRESACLSYLIRGKSARLIAETLGLSKRTVEFYIDNIKTKLGVRSKSELIERAFDYYNLNP